MRTIICKVIVRLFSFLSFWMAVIPNASAALNIEQVYPTLEQVGEELSVTIFGESFDESSRVTMVLDTRNAAAIISSIDTQGTAEKVAIAGTLAYVANGKSGLQIISILNPASPNVIGSVNTPGYAVSITLAGTLAYVADREKGLQIIDISNPAAPTIIGSEDTPGPAWDVTISDSLAYVADGENGLQVIDISDPTGPTVIGSVDTPGQAFGIAVDGDRAYLADGIEGVAVIDISDPRHPSIIGTVDTPGYAQDVAISNTLACVADGSGGLQMVDLSTPTNPSIIAAADTAGLAADVTIVGSIAYVADEYAGLQIVDISNPAIPSIIGSVDTSGKAKDVAAVGTIAYVASHYAGLQVVDLAETELSAVIGSFDTQGYARGVALSGTTAYLIDDQSDLTAIDISDVKAPVQIGTVKAPKWANNVAISGTKAFYAIGYNGLQVIDVSDPSNPTVIGSVAIPGYAYDVAVSGNFAFVTDYRNAVRIIDISDPKKPSITGFVNTPGIARDVTIVGTLAYLADSESGLQIIDISDPANPMIIGAVDMPGSANCVTVAGNLAFVANWEWGLRIIDISNPANPTIIGAVDTPGTSFRVTVIGNLAYVADDCSGVQVIDISDPTTPRIIGAVDTPGYAQDIFILNTIALVADDTSGLTIVPVPVEIPDVNVTSPTSITCTLPNPGLAGNYNLRVFNASESSEMTGAVTFLEAVDFESKADMKAVIVAGGGDYEGNALWSSTRLVANQAYKSLISQGYTKENIYYLGPHSVDLFPDDEIANDVDVPTTSANLAWALTSWAADASELLLFMTDHGKAGTFQLNPEEPYFQATQLDGWLDSLQAAMTGRVVCIYDACNSGSFIPLLTPPAGRPRVIIASSQADERAWFMNQGVNSFSYQFWSSAWLKGNLYDAFLDARNMMALDQTALLDADGDGIPGTKADQTTAGSIAIGRGRSAASLPPTILAVSPDQTLNGQTRASLWARLGTDALVTIDRVWAVVVPPDHSAGASDIPVTDLPSVDLVDADGDGTFTADYAGFTRQGAYRVIVYAKDTDDLYSLPETFYVDQLSDTSATRDGGYDITRQLWAKAVLEVAGTPVTLVWKMVGADITPSGDQVISGYFYADPKDFAYGSVYNPELFIKIYTAKNGWCNIAFNHVTVDPVSVHSAFNYAGSADQSGSATLTNRLVEHQYTGVAIDTSLQSVGESPAASSPSGCTLSSGLWARAVLKVPGSPVDLIWKAVGTDTTPSGDRVVSGYFYASPTDFAYGSLYNPELFVKVYIAKNGWANLAFNHVTVDAVDILSAHQYSGAADQSGSATLGRRLLEHTYTGVGQ